MKFVDDDDDEGAIQIHVYL